MKMIWDDKKPVEVLDYRKGYIQDIRDDKVPREDLIAGARLGKWLPQRVSGHRLYGKGATNPTAHPDAKDEADQSYVSMTGQQRAAAWHNIVISSESYPKLDKGDSYRYTFVKEGPTWIPNGGYVGFHDLEQIDDYELDIDLIIEKNIINKLDHIMYGIGLSNNMLREEEIGQRSLEDYM